MYQKLKSFLAEDIYFYPLLLVVISVVSFGLGRVSMLPPQETQQGSVILTTQPIKSEYVKDVSSTGSSAQEIQLVGSKNGSKYHAQWCPGAKQIREENKVYFDSVSDAAAHGYTQAGNCDM